MKLSLKTIIIATCAAIAMVVVYQFFWLRNMYHVNRKELRQTIINAMRTADYEELDLRIRGLKAESVGENEIQSEAILSNKGTMEASTNINIDMRDFHAEVATKDTIKFHKIEASEQAELHTELITSLMIRGLHHGLDGVRFPEVTVYDSIVTSELAKYDIDLPHYIDIYALRPGHTVQSTIDSTLYIARPDASHFEYSFGLNDEYAYRLTTENIDKRVLRRMAGILSASGLILLLLGALLYYLVRTIWRQKTLEELKNDFINNMTHELKTPLAVSYAAVDMLLLSEKAGESMFREKYLGVAKDQTQHLSELVETILSMTRGDAAKTRYNPESIDLAEMVGAITRAQSIGAGKEVDFAIDIEPAAMSVRFDRMHLANILNNLVENAIKYSGENVHIKIGARNTPSHSVISVEDNGVGIDSDKQKRVFDKFYRVPSGNRHNVKGFGLGLFYVRETVCSHGGEVGLESRPGHGSAFTIKIPRQ